MRAFLFVVAIYFVIIASSFTSADLAVTSVSFTNYGAIPAKYSCDGAGISPSLHVGNIPAGAKSLVLIVHDPEAPRNGGFTHWIVWNIDPKGDIPENFKGAMQGLNDAERRGYIGMCPPAGVHRYHFRVYALDAMLQLDKNTGRNALENAMNRHILAHGDLVGTYKRSK
jgi:hypothetical protein